jgi:protein-S-isoprenylcysteine O-methyltransferase Ste14
MQLDRGKYFGSLMMVGFGVFAFYRWHQTQLLFFLLLVLRDFAAGYFFFRRSPALVKSSLHITLLAYISAAMPLFYFSSMEASRTVLFVSDILAIIGFLFVSLATIELGASIGISPAKRKFVSTGIYRWIKHPMYAGYVISEIGMMLVNPLNLILFFISSSLYFLRARAELKILSTSPRN